MKFTLTQWLTPLWRISLIGALLLTWTACEEDEDTNLPRQEELPPPQVILDTDLGNCTDDLLAIQALFYIQSLGECRIIGMMTSMQLDLGRKLADQMLHHYKADDVPLGLLSGEEKLFEIVPYYQLADSLRHTGTALFPSTGIPLEERLPAYKLYRKLLAGAEDNSVVIACIGKYTNLGQLLDSSADEYSPLTGRELIQKKVRSLEAMGGCFTPVPLRYSSTPGAVEFLSIEYNVAGDIPMAKKVLENWPTELHLLPLEEGMKFPSNHDEILEDYAWQPDSPLYQIYSRYNEWAIGDIGQYWWDALVVAHVMLRETIFDCTEKGTLSIADDGTTFFTLSPDGNTHIIGCNASHTRALHDWLRGVSRFQP
ncbi:MAG: nucleoside hydrolase [Parabacteroides sp.]